MSKIEKAVQFMEQIAADNSHGYAQDNRNGSPDYDCSSLVGTALSKAGFKVNPLSTTRTLYKQLIDCGFKEIGVNEARKRGDIFLTAGKHVVMCTDANNIVHASLNEKGTIKNGQVGDQTGKEICCRSFYTPSYKWTYHLRYVENTPTPSTIKGVDVSGYNKITDYQAVKNDGVQFAILKIIRKDLNLDKLFETHLKGFNKVNLPIIGVYNYSYATSVAKSRSDASIVVKYLKQFNMPKSTVIYMDVEDNCQKGLGQLLIDMINAYQEVIEKAGYKFGLYTGLSFWNSYIKPYKSSLKCNVEWIARYKKGYSPMQFAENPEESSKPNIGTPIEGYQYTSSGQVSGIQGSVDLNILYNTSTLSSSPVIKNIVRVDTTLNVRNKPNGDIKGKLYNGDEVDISNYQDGFYRIGINQWVSASYIQSTRGIVNANILNIRKGAGTNYADIGNIPRNTIIPLLKEKKGWYYTVYDSIGGWVSAEYIHGL